MISSADSYQNRFAVAEVTVHEIQPNSIPFHDIEINHIFVNTSMSATDPNSCNFGHLNLGETMVS